jgi:hypothetical protein
MYYRCGQQTHSGRCNAKRLNAIKLEDFVWQECCNWIRNPGEYLAKAHEQLQKRLQQTVNVDEQRSQLQQALHTKATERERAITFGIRGTINEAELERQLAVIDQESIAIQAELRKLDSQKEVTTVLEQRYHDQETLLTTLHENLDAIIAAKDQEMIRQIIERMVASISAVTHGTGHHKEAEVTVLFFFEEKKAAFSNTIRRIAVLA